MIKRVAPPFVFAWTVVFVVSGTLIGGGGLGVGVETVALWFEILGVGAIGVILATRKPENKVGWLLLTSGFFYGLNILGESLAVYSAVELDVSLQFSQNVMMMAGGCFVLALAGLALVFLVFPTGHLLSPRWRWAAWFIAISILISAYSNFVVSRAVTDVEGFLANLWSLEHAGGPVDGVTAVIFSAGIGLQTVAILVGVASLLIRLRHSSGTELQQVKWVVYTFFVFAVLSVGFIANNQLDVPRWLVSVLVVAQGAVLTTGLAISVFRYRLFDIDRVISRTVSYGLLVALLAVVFAGAVALLSFVLPAQSNLAIAASTLAIAALFNPLRKRVQATVDRRFNRSRYNAQLVIDQFAGSLQDRLEVQGLIDDWIGVVTETMEPSSAGVWIKNAPAGER